MLGIPEWVWRFSIAMLINASGAVAIVIGIRLWRPEPALPWYMLAASQAIYAVADFIFYWEYYIDHSRSYPSLADVFYLGRVPFIIVGLALILRRRSRADRAAIIDSLIVAMGVGVLIWVFLIEPYTVGQLGLSFRLVSIAYPATDLMLVVMAMFLVVGGGHRTPSFYLLTGGLALLVADDSLYGWRNLHGNLFSSGSITEIGWLVYYLSAGACALHPSMRDLTKPLPQEAIQRSRARIWLLGAATLVGPVLLIAEGLSERPVDAVPIGLATFAIAVLVTFRLTDVVRHLDQSERRFHTLAHEAPIGIMQVSLSGIVEIANPRIGEITGRDIATLLGRGWVDAVYPDDREQLFGMIEREDADPTRVVTRLRIQRPDAEIRHVQLSVAPITARADSGFVVSVEDVTKEVEIQEALQHQAFYDMLTGLANRSLLMDRLGQELAGGARHNSTVAVLSLDLDDFKDINDSLGHQAGDAILKEVSSRFTRGMRAGETAARFGGDEFVFIIRDVQRTDDAVAAATRLLDVLASPIRCADQDLMVTASIGIVLPPYGADAESALRDADTAMYEAKKEGKCGWVLFDEALHRRTVERLHLEGELRRGLAEEEFEVFYQPVVEPETGRPVGAEALIRWQHPTRGLVGPAEFIPAAEASGQIRQIGSWVLERALAQMASWDASEFGPRLESLAVNLSARQLGDREALDLLRSLLSKHAIDPSRVCVEVTESVMMADGERTRKSLDGLKDLGVRMALDDFGTGYSSLAYLHKLSVDTVKIDRSFTERLGGTDDSTPVVKAINDMSHAMGLRIVAEGVSSARLARAVTDLGCDQAQGFYWAKPLPAEEFADWWRNVDQPEMGGAILSTGTGELIDSRR
jgi:diguanylate cyclase (GGDEF)-like protein/PAS domain S-box-containing protein